MEMKIQDHSVGGVVDNVLKLSLDCWLMRVNFLRILNDLVATFDWIYGYSDLENFPPYSRMYPDSDPSSGTAVDQRNV